MGFLITLPGHAWAMYKWLRDIKKQGESRLSPVNGKKDRLALECIARAMSTGDIKALPWRLRWLCKWLKKLGLLDNVGVYLQVVLKSRNLWHDDPVLRAYQDEKKP